MNMMMLSKMTVGTPTGERRSIVRPKISECLPPTTPPTPPRTPLDERKGKEQTKNATGTPPISRRRRKKQISGLSGMFADKEGTSNNKDNEISDTSKVHEQQPSVSKFKPAIFSDPHPDPDAARKTDQAGRTPLHVAVAFREGLGVVEHLLKAFPAAAEFVDNGGMTPLMLACKQGRHADRQVIKALIRASPSTVLYENDDGMTALECCLVTEVPLAIFKMMRKVCAWEQRRRAEREKRDALEAHREMKETLRSLSLNAGRSSSEDQIDGKSGSFSDMNLPTFVEPSPPQFEMNENVCKINSPSSVKFARRRTSMATHLQVVASSA